MAKGKKMYPAKTVDEYISRYPSDVQVKLRSIRSTIKKAAPNAEEGISYAIPGYKYYGVLIYFAAFEKHISIYPAPRLNDLFKKELQSYKGGKGTIQFPLSKPIPLNLVTRIVKFRIKQNETIKGNKKAGVDLKNVIKSKAPEREQVANYIRKLDPSIKVLVEELRAIIKKAGKNLSERIKWNAPSYHLNNTDLFTFALHRKGQVILVFHHPSVVRIKSALLKGEYKSRRIVYFDSLESVKINRKEFHRIIQELINAITKK